MSKKRLFLIGASTLVTWVAAAGWIARNGGPHARRWTASNSTPKVSVSPVATSSRPLAATPAKAEEPLQGDVLLAQARAFLKSVEGIGLRVSADPPEGRGVAAREQYIAGMPEFRSFASSAGLEPEQEQALAHVLALHYENTAALESVVKDADRLTSMKLQLVADTTAQVRARLSDPAWDSFSRSGLLVGLTPAVHGG